MNIYPCVNAKQTKAAYRSRFKLECLEFSADNKIRSIEILIHRLKGIVHFILTVWGRLLVLLGAEKGFRTLKIFSRKAYLKSSSDCMPSLPFTK